jgi:hypothetical protein
MKSLFEVFQEYYRVSSINVNFCGTHPQCVLPCLLCAYNAQQRVTPTPQRPKEWFSLTEVFQQAGSKFPFKARWKFMDRVREYLVTSIGTDGCWYINNGPNFFNSLAVNQEEYQLVTDDTEVTVTISVGEPIYTVKFLCSQELCPDLLRNGHNKACEHYKEEQ